MQFQISFFAAGLFFGGANSAVIDIQAVDLAFKPEVIHASPGDVLEFHFFPHNHSVVMGDFDKPCLAADSGGFYSGFVSPLAGEAVSTSFMIMFWPPLEFPPARTILHLCLTPYLCGAALTSMPEYSLPRPGQRHQALRLLLLPGRPRS